MLGPHTVTVIQPASRDNWGDTQPGDTEIDVKGCFWQPRTTSERTTGQDTVTINPWVNMPPSAPILETSRVRFEGVTYEVDGEPALHHTPAGPHHYEVQLAEVKG
jgi:hypothetical protein